MFMSHFCRQKNMNKSVSFLISRLQMDIISCAELILICGSSIHWLICMLMFADSRLIVVISYL